MDSTDFQKHLNEMQKFTVDTLAAKAKEYATDDRLHNFKQAANLQRVHPISALAGMMAKHTVSVYDLIRDTEAGCEVPLELWQEKVTDHINYLYLLWALINEKAETAQYEDAEEQSRLIMLPVPIGGVMYATYEYEETDGSIVRGIEEVHLSGYVKEGEREFYTTYDETGTCDFGPDEIFAAHEDAVAALKKMEGKS